MLRTALALSLTVSTSCSFALLQRVPADAPPTTSCSTGQGPINADVLLAVPGVIVLFASTLALANGLADRNQLGLVAGVVFGVPSLVWTGTFIASARYGDRAVKSCVAARERLADTDPDPPAEAELDPARGASCPAPTRAPCPERRARTGDPRWETLDGEGAVCRIAGGGHAGFEGASPWRPATKISERSCSGSSGSTGKR
jgi:hypothetical protein